MFAPKSVSVGDVTSNLPGTAARFNEGKSPLELIPLDTLSILLQSKVHSTICDMLLYVGLFQIRDDNIRTLYQAFEELERYCEQNDLPSALELTASVLDFGRHKYAEWNWVKGQPWSVVFGCIARHSQKLQYETLDTDSGLHHVGHIGANLVFLMEFAAYYKEGDDRCKFYIDNAVTATPMTGTPVKSFTSDNVK